MRFAILRVLAVFMLMGVSSNQAFACACCGSWQVANVASWDVLNVRSGPGTRYNVVGTLRPGTSCIIRHKECRRRWCRISYADFSGWVNVRYLKWLP